LPELYTSDLETLKPLVRWSRGHYLVEFAGVISRIEAMQGASSSRADGLTNAFFGQNAVSYLGLHQRGGNRRRIEEFYARKGIDAPDWMRKLS